MMAMSTPDQWQQWLAASMRWRTVSAQHQIAGHKQPGASDQDVRGML